MENGKRYFHSDTQGLHLLFEPFLIDEENGGLLPGYIFIALLCASERGLSYYMDYRQHNESLPTLTATTGQRIAKVMIRTILYGIITTLRLLYMLVVMYFNTGLFILVVCSLTLSQMFIEIVKSSSSSHCSNKTGPLITKFQNNKGYSDLSTMETAANDEEEEEDDYNDSSEAYQRQYNIPTIIISNEKSCCTPEQEEEK